MSEVTCFVGAFSLQLGSSTRTVSTAQWLLSFLMSLLACFSKEVGPDYALQSVKTLVDLFSSAGFYNAITTALQNSRQVRPVSAHRRCLSDGTTTTSSSIFLLASLLRLLTQVTTDRSLGSTNLVPHICQLALDKLQPLVLAVPVELMTRFLDLTERILADHWRSFVVTEGGALKGGGPIVKRFTSPEAQETLDRMMNAPLACLQTAPDLPPSKYGEWLYPYPIMTDLDFPFFSRFWAVLIHRLLCRCRATCFSTSGVTQSPGDPLPSRALPGK